MGSKLMKNFNIERLHIEQLILSCFLNQHRTTELDEMEFREYKLPFELFKASRTTKMISKAIYNFQLENKPVDEVLILEYIKKQTHINEIEVLDILSCTWCTFDTMISYIEMLKEIDKNEKKQEILRKTL